MSTISVTTKHGPLAFLRSMTKINLTVDGSTTTVDDKAPTVVPRAGKISIV